MIEVLSNRILEVVQHGCTKSPDPWKPPYFVPNGEVAIVPGLNVTYMKEQLARNVTVLGTLGDEFSAAASVATA